MYKYDRRNAVSWIKGQSVPKRPQKPNFDEIFQSYELCQKYCQIRYFG